MNWRFCPWSAAFSAPKNFSDPIHLDGTHPSGIAAISKDKLVVNDRLCFPPKKTARRMDGHRLVACNGLVRAVRDKVSNI